MRFWLRFSCWAGNLILALVLLVLIAWPIAASAWFVWTEGEATAPVPGSSTSGLVTERWSRPVGLGWTTLKLVGLTELVAFAVGLPLAIVVFRTDAWGRRVALSYSYLARSFRCPFMRPSGWGLSGISVGHKCWAPRPS